MIFVEIDGSFFGIFQNDFSENGHFLKRFYTIKLYAFPIFQNPIIIIVYAIFQNAEASFFKMDFFILFFSFCKMTFPILKNEILIRSFFKTTKMRLPGINCVQSNCIQYVIFLTIQYYLIR